MSAEKETEEVPQETDDQVKDSEVLEFSGINTEEHVMDAGKSEEISFLEAETTQFSGKEKDKTNNLELTANKEFSQATEVAEIAEVTEIADTIQSVELKEPANNVTTPEVVVLPLELTPVSTSRKQILTNTKEIIEVKPSRKPSKSGYVKCSRGSVTRLQVFRQFCLTGFLIIAVFAYGVLGAILFLNLEQERDIAYNENIDKWKNDTAILLATELRQVKPYEEIWANKIFLHLEIFERDLLKAIAIGYKRREDRDGCQRWSPENSFAFSMSLMTTTGFGALTPRSDWGRTAAVCYSLFGIPLMITCLYKCGLYLSIFWLYLFQLLCPVTDYSSTTLIHDHSLYRKTKHKSNSVAPIIKTEMLSKMAESYQARLRTRENVQLRTRISNDGIESWRSAMMVVVDILLKYPEHFPSVDIPSFIKDIRDHISDSYTKNNEANYKRRCYHKPARCAENMLCAIEKLSKLDRAVAMVFALLLLVIYIVFGSVIHFAVGIAIEDSLYLNFLMLSTLGSGCHELDDDISQITNLWKFLWPCYLFFGYCIVSMILHLFHKFFSQKALKRHSNKHF